MQEYLITVESEYQGMRLDAFLASQTGEELSRSFIVRLIEKGGLSVNGLEETSKKIKIKGGDIIKLSVPEPEAIDVAAEDIPLDIVYEDEAVAVINKPRGMVVHPAPGNETGTMVNALLFHFKDLSSIGGKLRPGIVHRIDRDTSGLLMVAKNDIAHKSLSEQLKVHSITRVYDAVVYNSFRDDEGTVDAPIGRSKNNRFKMAVVPDGRRAVTHYKVVERLGNFTRIEARLETGRTHQIRVHMSHIRHPLLGDEVYGSAKKVMGAETQMLHAKVLGFVHPITGEYMEFKAPLPEHYVKVLDRLRKK